MPSASVPKPFGLLTSSPPAPRARPRTSFEINLVPPSMRALRKRRHGCADCDRTPLIGEQVFYYGEHMVCELCRPLRREPPGHAEVVHSGEHRLTVKRLSRPAAR
jgi:hypothetical protein